MMTEAKPNVSEAAEEKLKEIITRYPSRRSATLPALYIAQEEFGFVSDEAILWVAERLEVSPAEVLEVATFYTMYYQKPVGKYHVQVCRTLSCMLAGAEELKAFIRKRLGISPGEVSEDGMWSWEEVECLGSCGSGPMIEINDVYFERLSVEKLEEVFSRIEREKPDLRYSTIREELGGGFSDHPRSQVVCGSRGRSL